MVHVNAGAVPVYGAPLEEGQMLPVMGNQALYWIFFGTNGETEFGVPALHNRTMTGESRFALPNLNEAALYGGRRCWLACS
jgi:microcystin-dependent protein